MIILDRFVLKSFYTWFNQCDLDYIAMQQSLANCTICKFGCKSMTTSTQEFQLSQQMAQYTESSFLPTLLDHIFVVHIWPFVCSTKIMPLLASLQDWKHVSQFWKVFLGILKDLKHLSQSWKEQLDTHVLWLAYQVFEVDVATST